MLCMPTNQHAVCYTASRHSILYHAKNIHRRTLPILAEYVIMSEPDKPDEFNKPDEFDEQKQQQWQARIAQKRLDLSQSVEETLADTSLLREDDWLDEEDELNRPASDAPFADEPAEQANVKDTALIPPRLSLQSKPMPVVRPDAPAPPRESLAAQPPTSPPAQPPAVDPTQSRPRLAGRTTRVLLKAIVRSESEEAPETGATGQSPPEERTGAHGVVAGQAEDDSEAKLRQVVGVGPMLFGSGVFKHGQCDVVMDNTHVTHSSVIVVMLTSDPGPMVVQYVSLQPQVGFTVHLSAPAEKEASFNYVILPGELL